jgi:hypothetical protein
LVIGAWIWVLVIYLTNLFPKVSDPDGGPVSAQQDPEMRRDEELGSMDEEAGIDMARNRLD